MRGIAYLAGLWLRRPVASAGAHLRLIVRALEYLARSPDVLRFDRFVVPSPLPSPVLVLLIVERGTARFALRAGGAGRWRLLPVEALRRIDFSRAGEGAERACEALARGNTHPPRLVVVDARALDRLRDSIVPGIDPFLAVARSGARLLQEGLAAIRPEPQEARILREIGAGDILDRFGPRFGLERRYRARPALALAGLKLIVAAVLGRLGRSRGDRLGPAAACADAR